MNKNKSSAKLLLTRSTVRNITEALHEVRGGLTGAPTSGPTGCSCPVHCGEPPTRGHQASCWAC
jgi:hypothetical protein